ncbi:unnamed protein product, partial [Rotaria sordida]
EELESISSDISFFVTNRSTPPAVDLTFLFHVLPGSFPARNFK